MELGEEEVSLLEEEDSPYIVEEQIQPLEKKTTAPELQYYRKAMRYYRTGCGTTAGAAEAIPSHVAYSNGR